MTLERDEGDSTCDVCGEECIGREHIALMLWGVGDRNGGHWDFVPKESIAEKLGQDWQDVEPSFLVHRECLSIFFDGWFADFAAKTAARKGG